MKDLSKEKELQQLILDELEDMKKRVLKCNDFEHLRWTFEDLDDVYLDREDD
jgi:hypothetical protein